MASCLVLVVLLIGVCDLMAVSQQPHTLGLQQGFSQNLGHVVVHLGSLVCG